MDLFGGVGGVSKAVQRIGYRAKIWDLKYGPLHDLTDRRVLGRILQEIKKGRVLAVMMAPVCTSFSRARDRTKVIRSKRFPWGIPRRFLSAHEEESIRVGNAVFRSCFAIIDLCNKLCIPWILENPLSSRCWNLPKLRTLLQTQQAYPLHADFCQYGTTWKKPTMFLANYIGDTHRLCRVCRGQAGVCSATNKRHFMLTGSGPGGVPWTKIAEPYPVQLCRELAHVLTSPYHTTFNMRNPG